MAYLYCSLQVQVRLCNLKVYGLYVTEIALLPPKLFAVCNVRTFKTLIVCQYLFEVQGGSKEVCMVEGTDISRPN